MARYTFHNSACRDHAGNHRKWCIVGKMEDGSSIGGGILEWCIDEDDANHLLKQMKTDRRFSDLRVERYSVEENEVD